MKIKKIIGWSISLISALIFISTLVYLVVMKFNNVDMTEMRFLITYWKQFLVVFISTVGMYGGLKLV